MATELETKQETTQRRVFTGLNVSALKTEYRRPNFSGINFEDVGSTTTVISEKQTPTITRNLEIQKNTTTVDEKIANHPQTPASFKLNARGKIILSVAIICICSLMAFMIGNLVTLSSLNAQVSYKQSVVASQQEAVNALKNQSADITSSMEQNAYDNGFVNVDSSDITYSEAVTKLSKPSANIEGNWFDNLCNFFANMFK